MNPRKPQFLLLSLAVTAALAACSRSEAPAPAATDAAPAALQLTLDESALPGVNRFALDDLDAGEERLHRFRLLRQRQVAGRQRHPVRPHQLGRVRDAGRALHRHPAPAGRAGGAARRSRMGVEKIVGDLWATGMDEAKINAQGIEPIKPVLAAIDGLQDKDAIAAYLRDSAAKGQAFLFGFGAEADFNKPDTNMAYAFQGGLGLPDKNFYFDADKKNIRDEYVKHIAKVLELSGVAAADAASRPPTSWPSRPAWPRRPGRARRCRATSRCTTTR